jgi:hypothetical protein
MATESAAAAGPVAGYDRRTRCCAAYSNWRDLPMKLTRRSLLLLIAVVCFVLVAIGVGFEGVSLTAIGLAAFAGAFLVDERGLKLG